MRSAPTSRTAPTAGTETADPLEFLARVLVHMPDKGHVTTRYYGRYANRPRGMRRQAQAVEAETPPRIVPAPRWAPTEAARRWAALLQQIFEVAPLRCAYVPRRDADRRVHYAGVGDRPDRDPPPHPRRRRGAARGAEPALDLGSAGVTLRRRSARPLTAPAPTRPHESGARDVPRSPASALTRSTPAP